MIRVYDNTGTEQIASYDYDDVHWLETREFSKPSHVEMTVNRKLNKTLHPMGSRVIISQNTDNQEYHYYIYQWDRDYQQNTITYILHGVEDILRDTIQVYSCTTNDYEEVQGTQVIKYFPPIHIPYLIDPLINNISHLPIRVYSRDYTDDDRTNKEGLMSFRELLTDLENKHINYYWGQEPGGVIVFFVFKEHSPEENNHGKIDTLIDLDSVTWSINEDECYYNIVPEWSIAVDDTDKRLTWDTIKDYWNLTVNPGDSLDSGAYIDDQDHTLKWKIPGRTAQLRKPAQDMIVYNDSVDRLYNFIKIGNPYLVRFQSQSTSIKTLYQEEKSDPSPSPNPPPSGDCIGVTGRISTGCGDWWDYDEHYCEWVNYCPNCGASGTLLDNPKGVPEHEITCSMSLGGCDSDYDAVNGYEKSGGCYSRLTPCSGGGDSNVEGLIHPRVGDNYPGIYETQKNDVFFEMEEKLLKSFKDSITVEVHDLPNASEYRLGDVLDFKDPIIDYTFQLRVEKTEKVLDDIKKSIITLKPILRDNT